MHLAIAAPLRAGILTGRKANYSSALRTCEIQGWCPAEVDTVETQVAWARPRGPAPWVPLYPGAGILGAALPSPAVPQTRDTTATWPSGGAPREVGGPSSRFRLLLPSSGPLLSPRRPVMMEAEEFHYFHHEQHPFPFNFEK